MYDQLLLITIFFYLPEIFNKNITHHCLYYKITLVNFQYENIDFKGDLYSKPVLSLCFKDFWYTTMNLSQKSLLNSFSLYQEWKSKQ